MWPAATGPRPASRTRSISASGLMSLSFMPDVKELSPPPGNECCDQLRDEMRIRFGDQPWLFRYLPDDLLTIRIIGPRGMYEARMDRKRVIIITAHIFIVWTVAFSVLLLLTSYLFLRNQIRSILQLSWAADAFGRGEDVPSRQRATIVVARKATGLERVEVVCDPVNPPAREVGPLCVHKEERREQIRLVAVPVGTSR